MTKKHINILIAEFTSAIMKGDKTMKKIDVVKLAKGAGMLLSIGGMVLTSWVGSKENEKTLQKLVDERLQK